MQDTLKYVANSESIQQLAVLLQGLFLVAGAVLSLFQRKR